MPAYAIITYRVFIAACALSDLPEKGLCCNPTPTTKNNHISEQPPKSWSHPLLAYGTTLHAHLPEV